MKKSDAALLARLTRELAKPRLTESVRKKVTKINLHLAKQMDSKASTIRTIPAHLA